MHRHLLAPAAGHLAEIPHGALVVLAVIVAVVAIVAVSRFARRL